VLRLRGQCRTRSNHAELADAVASLGLPEVTRLTFPPSREGVRAKLRYMRELIDEDRSNPYVRALAARILRAAGVPPTDPLGRARALFDWVQQEFLYMHEPVETFTRPRRLLLDADFHFGDCDDFTLALATLHEAAGCETSLEALGWEGRFRHVFHRVLAGRKWYAAEATLPQPFGFDPTARAAEKHGAGEYVPA
jgi:hypothetical protein